MTQAPLPVLDDYWDRGDGRQQAVNALFDRGAAHYDWICRAMSFGSGQKYRHDALARAGIGPGMAVLDVGTGTGLLAREALALVGRTGRVTGVDPSSGMIAAFRTRTAIGLVRGVGERLPFADGRFDVVTMGYALRHVADLDEAFTEYRRVLKPGGRVLLLEITAPQSRAGRSLARAYFRGVVPLVARIGTGSADAARLMRFYWDTIAACVPVAAVVASLARAGFDAPRCDVHQAIFSEYSAVRAA